MSTEAESTASVIPEGPDSMPPFDDGRGLDFRHRGDAWSPGERNRGTMTGSRKRRIRVLLAVENNTVPFDRRVWQEAETLRDAGHDVTVICPGHRRLPDSGRRWTGSGYVVTPGSSRPGARGPKEATILAVIAGLEPDGERDSMSKGRAVSVLRGPSPPVRLTCGALAPGRATGAEPAEAPPQRSGEARPRCPTTL